jgi:hypothetical protein
MPALIASSDSAHMLVSRDISSGFNAIIILYVVFVLVGVGLTVGLYVSYLMKRTMWEKPPTPNTNSVPSTLPINVSTSMIHSAGAVLQVTRSCKCIRYEHGHFCYSKNTNYCRFHHLHKQHIKQQQQQQQPGKTKRTLLLLLRVQLLTLGPSNPKPYPHTTLPDTNSSNHLNPLMFNPHMFNPHTSNHPPLRPDKVNLSNNQLVVTNHKHE